MKIKFRFITQACLITILAIGFFGWDSIRINYSVSQQKLTAWLSEQAGPDYELKRLEVILDEQRDVLGHRKEKIQITQIHLDRAEKKQIMSKNELQKQRDLIHVERNLCEMNGNKCVVIGNRIYSRADLEQSLRGRLQLCENIEREISANEQTIQILEEQITSVSQNLQKAEEIIRQYEKKLVQFGQRLEHHQFWALIEQLGGSAGFHPRNEGLSVQFQRLEDKIKLLEAKPYRAIDSMINHEVVTHADLLHAVDEYLGQKE